MCLVQGGQSTEQSKLAEDLLSSIAPRMGPMLSVPSGFLASHVRVPTTGKPQTFMLSSNHNRRLPVVYTWKLFKWRCVCACVRAYVRCVAGKQLHVHPIGGFPYYLSWVASIWTLPPVTAQWSAGLLALCPQAEIWMHNGATAAA